MKSVLVCVVLALCIAGCSENGTWSIGGGGNYETSFARALYSPDPNGGIGLKVVSDNTIPEDTNVNVAVGPCLTFNVTELVGNSVNVVVPGQWEPLAKQPAKVYGTLSMLYETEQHTLLSTPGMEIHLMPDWKVHPMISLDYVWTEGGSLTDDGLKTMFGADYRF